MKINIYSIMSQVYITPFIKVTHDRYLNGNRELIFGWIKWELCVSFK